MKPNLFKYATSELSQDAIICYLLEWAREPHSGADHKLHQLAVAFLDSLFEKFGDIDKPLKYEKIEIKKQYNRIDILCIVNDAYAMIIEDKTNTKNHSNQLQRYVHQVRDEFDSAIVLPIYFKTGDQSNYKNVIEKGYRLYLRGDFLKVLKTYDGENEIILEYTSHLQAIEDSIKSYRTLPIEKWRYSSWKGFFIELKKRLGEGNWDYVSNPNGGFLGFWWNWDGNDAFHIYLQIDHSMKRITFKLQTKTGQKIEKSIVNRWKKLIKYDKNGIVINRPKVVRTGKSVTIGILENEFRIVNSDGMIDMDRTVDFIRKIEEVKKQKLNEY